MQRHRPCRRQEALRGGASEDRGGGRGGEGGRLQSLAVMAGSGHHGVDNTVRKKWDKEEWQAKADEKARLEKEQDGQELTARQKKFRARDPLHLGLIQERSALKREEIDKYRVDYGARVGKKEVVSLVGDRSKQGGFYCAVCDILMKDSLAYADHLNGKMHLRLLGMSQRVERSTVGSVKGKLAALKRQREAKSTTDPEKEYEQKIARLMEEDEERKRKRKEAKLEKKKKEREEREREEEENKQDVDEDLMAAMGFSGFGGSAK